MGEEAPLSLPARLKKLLGRIRRGFTIDTFDVFTRAVPAELCCEPPAGYVFAWGTTADVERCDPRHTDLDPRERREGALRLGLGHRVVIAFHRGEPVFSMWVNPRNLNVPGLVKRRLAAHQWFIYKAFTSPEHRGRKLYETGMLFVLAEMATLGLKELVGYAHVKKTVSRKGLAALEFGSAGRVTQIDWPFFATVRVSRELAARFPRSVPRTEESATEVRPA